MAESELLKTNRMEMKKCSESQCLMNVGQEYNRQLTAEEIEAILKTYRLLSEFIDTIIPIDEETASWIKYSAFSKHETFEVALNRLLSEYYNISLEKYYREIDEVFGVER